MTGKVAIVTGASQGTGRSTAVRLARDFDAIALVARSRQQLGETAAQVRDAAHRMTGTTLRMDGGTSLAAGIVYGLLIVYAQRTSAR